ncbi:O-antigen ligase family protein [Capnocytophaga sp.]|uniref:O-antigen ligase family protein n=1 Tax=Capnocytophaga sp. TaxID=44737 RepID=UPI0026DC66A9|nr:O-antigen ligase family protein [Capnocytophaga sp.]MDO5106469.1 O-antigen ligase family protein [Capnocytophaga sp.]
MKSKNKSTSSKRNQTAVLSAETTEKNMLTKLLATILLIAYGYVTVVTPNWLAFDSNAPKFYTFAILNLVVTGLFFFVKDFREKQNALFGFFTNKIGIAYSVMIVCSLLSFTKVINVEEGILHFFKVFTAFSAAWMVSALVIYNPRAVTSLAVAMTLLLFYDALKTFEGISRYIKGIGVENDIKSSYSNKNILSSAMFIKIPFAIWLFYFKRGALKYIGGAGILLGTLSIFFMSTRAFYIGTFVMLFTLIIYGIVDYFFLKRKKILPSVGLHVLFVAITFGIFAFVQGNVYPKHLRASTSFGARLATIDDTDNISNNLRKTAWTTTVFEMIPNDPLLGVGIGNWKVRYLEHENSYSPHYIYMYKAHNDFLEVTAESGVVAGLAFIGIFLLVGYYFRKGTYVRKNEEVEALMFLPLVGLFAYSFDAFFNFPQDRPEIQSLFSIFVGIGVAMVVLYLSKEEKTIGMLQKEEVVLENHSVIQEKESEVRKKDLGLSKKGQEIRKKESKLHNNPSEIHKKDSEIRNNTSVVKKNPSLLLGIIGVVAVSVCVANVVVQKMYFDSSKIQRMVKEEQQNIRKTKSTADYLMQNYPKVPNLTAVAEPVDVEKARYLIDEKKFDKARAVLSSIAYHPWDGRPEYFMAVSYFMQEDKNYDSIYKYAHKARSVKPNFFGNINLETFALNNLGREKESIALWKDFLGLSADSVPTEKPKKWKGILKNSFHVDVDKAGKIANRSEAQAWNALAYLQEKNGLIDQAKITLDSAFVYLPDDKTIIDNRLKITSRVNAAMYGNDFNEAVQVYQQKAYAQAVVLFTKFLEKVPAHIEALRLRGISYYYTQEHQKAINDFQRMESLGMQLDAVTLNFRASCHYMLGDKAAAKQFFEKSAGQGNADAQRNLQNLAF